jgi:hypothetical protein
MSFRLIAAILLWVFLFVEHWYEYKEWGNLGWFIMFLVFAGVCFISYYLEWKWKEHFRTPDPDRSTS